MKISTKILVAPSTPCSQNRKEQITSLNPHAVEEKRFQKPSVAFGGKDDPVFRLDKLFGDFI
ncbi:MAG: hypothetical protein K2X66_08670, partial [Cyanobacteria bacterium]|nr:hypothetical protein [Cyanobacteriota bacterium]